MHVHLSSEAGEERASGAADLAARLVALLGIAQQFPFFVEAVLARVRASLGVPPAGTPGFHDPIVDEEIAAARARLLAFRPAFLEAQAGIHRKHAGASLPDLVELLGEPRVQALLELQHAVAGDVAQALRTLGETMTATILYEEAPREDAPATSAGGEA